MLSLRYQRRSGLGLKAMLVLFQIFFFVIE